MAINRTLDTLDLINKTPNTLARYIYSNYNILMALLLFLSFISL